MSREWKERSRPPLYGDPMCAVQFQRGDEDGDIVVEAYGLMFRVASFLPGNQVGMGGDTVKTEPERMHWCSTRAQAEETLDLHIALAKGDGWSEVK